MKKALIKVKNLLDRLKEDKLGVYTAQSAYFTFLSLIPFAILLLSLIKYINLDQSTLQYILAALVPNLAKSNVIDMIQEVYSKSLGTISISAVFLLWSATKSFYSLSLGISSIYKSENKENHILLRVKGLVWTIVIIIVLVMTLLLIVFGNRLNEIIQENFAIFSDVSEFILDIRTFLVIIALFVTFLFMYRFIPSKKGNRLKNQIPGALLASIGWFAISYFFSIYVDVFTNFSIIYGSLTTVILLMMWLYAIIYLILLGAELNVILTENNSYSKIKLFFKNKFIKNS